MFNSIFFLGVSGGGGSYVLFFISFVCFVSHMSEFDVLLASRMSF